MDDWAISFGNISILERFRENPLIYGEYEHYYDFFLTGEKIGIIYQFDNYDIIHVLKKEIIK